MAPGPLVCEVIELKFWIQKVQPIRKALKTLEFVLSEAILVDEKSSEAPDRFTRRSAHLCQKRFVLDNTCFVDANLLHNCSLGMQKQDGYEQVKGKVKRYLQETIISDETVQDEEALWKKLLPNLMLTFYIYRDETGWQSTGGKLDTYFTSDRKS